MLREPTEPSVLSELLSCVRRSLAPPVVADVVAVDPEPNSLCVDVCPLRRALTRASVNVLWRAMAASTQLPGVPPERWNVVCAFGSVVVALLVCAQAGSAIRPTTSVMIAKRIMDIPLNFADQGAGRQVPLLLL